MNTIYLKTAKAERESVKLSITLKRVLTLLDGRSGSDDLARRAAPSLRKVWSELINELVKGGYIVANPGANIEPKDRPAPKSGAATSASELAYQKLLAAERVIAALEAAAAADKAKSHIGTERVIAALETAAAADKAKSDLEAKAKADVQQKVERAARAAELRTFFAAAKDKGEAEIMQAEQEGAPARAEIQAAAIAKGRSDTEAKPNAGPKKSQPGHASSIAELEAAINAAKTRSDSVEKTKSQLKLKSGMHANDTHRLHELEVENEALKKLLVGAYAEIAALNATIGTKR